MNIKKFAIGSIVGTVSILVLGEIIFGMLFSDFYDANSSAGFVSLYRESRITWALAVGNLMYALLLMLVMETRNTTGSLARSMLLGAAVGALAWGNADFIWYSNVDARNLAVAITDTLLEGVRGGLTGLIIAAVLSKIPE